MKPDNLAAMYGSPGQYASAASCPIFIRLRAAA
ncbi:hypothetical protein J2S69_000857 [Glycomyces lechevalierae]|uniref:Uncharacterized protein n=1 Tax=Glycomyces lechevalierae TaxID=256034 RepID=A0ABU2AKK2_9ACTN|nr:hypothetical protein [Glycomyces lechevalierae]